MELRRYAHLLRRRIAIVLLAVVVGLAAGYLTSDRTSKYQAEASIYVGSRQFAAIVDSTNASAAMARLTQTFAAIIRSDAVASLAIQLVNAPRTPSQVVSSTNATVFPNSNFIGVFVTDTDPVIAQSLADGMAQSFVSLVPSLEPAAPSGSGSGSGSGAPAVTTVAQKAARPTSPLPTSTRKNLALGALLGLAGGVAAVALLNYLDVRVTNPEDIERGAGVTVLGTIPMLRRGAAALRAGAGAGAE